MKKLIILILAISSASVFANCLTNVIMTPDGKSMYCTTCCDQSGVCSTTCL